MRALDHVDLSIEPGQVVGLLGPNGSGKTTMIKLAAGLLQPTEGEILIDGSKPGPQTKAQTAYLPDRDFLPDYMKVAQLMKYYRDFFADFNEHKAVEMFQDLGIQPDMVVRHMSKGMLEKVQLILCMSRDARVYLLDEPIGGVGPAARDYIIRTIIGNYNPEAAVIISTHLISDVEPILEDVIFLKQGSVVIHDRADTLREEKGKSIDELFREVFRC